jgi:hypothetical protein
MEAKIYRIGLPKYRRYFSKFSDSVYPNVTWK